MKIKKNTIDSLCHQYTVQAVSRPEEKCSFDLRKVQKPVRRWEADADIILRRWNDNNKQILLLQGHRPMQNITQHIDKLTHVHKWANVHLLQFVISLYK